MFSRLEASVFIIDSHTWRNKVMRNPIKDNHRHFFLLYLFKMIEHFRLAGNGNDQSINQTVEQPAGIHYFATKGFIALADHDSITSFKCYLINTPHHRS